MRVTQNGYAAISTKKTHGKRTIPAPSSKTRGVSTIFVDAEIVKDGTSYLVSKNDLTGTSLEVLSFIPSKIKKRSGSDHSDGRPGRTNYHSEDEYRTIRMTVESTAADMHDIAHLRDAIYDLFDGEFYIREKRIMNVAVEYESPGERTGELQLSEPQYVNGKQIYVAHVGDVEISDDDLQSTFVVEMETVELPYFESIYTTLELHDSGYSSTVEKYGLVDNIDSDNVQYRFTENQFTVHNAGNVTIEPESMYLNITLGMVVTDDVFQLTNKTTGEMFEWRKPVDGRNIYIRGMNVSEGTAYNGFRDTNRRFISLMPGDNEFEVSGGTFSQISFDTKYYYK